MLDVKIGGGAFMKDREDARTLARTMVGLGEAGRQTVALLTAMDQPLGRAVGNALEVAESVEVLAAGGPADYAELTLALTREMLVGAGRGDVDPAAALADGRAMDVWRRMIAAQGGDPDAPLPKPAETHVVTASATGTLTRLDAFSSRGGRLAAGCRTGPQGGPGVGRRGRRLDRGRGGAGDRRSAVAGAADRRRRAHPAGAGGAGGCVRGSTPTTSRCR